MALLTLSRIFSSFIAKLFFNRTFERAILDLASIGISFLSVLLFIALAMLVDDEPDYCLSMVCDDECGIVDDPDGRLRQIPMS